MSTDHAYLKTKACTVCAPLAWPLTSPGQSGCLRKEGPASCCWCYPLCNPSAHPTPPHRLVFSLKACGEAPLSEAGEGMEGRILTQGLKSRGQGFLRVASTSLLPPLFQPTTCRELRGHHKGTLPPTHTAVFWGGNKVGSGRCEAPSPSREED